MSLFKFRNGSNSLLRFRAIKGYFKVLANKKNSEITDGKLINRMSVKYKVRGDK